MSKSNPVSQSVDVYEADELAELSTFADTLRISTENVTFDFDRDVDGYPRCAIQSFVTASVPDDAEAGDVLEVIGYLAIDEAEQARALIAHLTSIFHLEAS